MIEVSLFKRDCFFFNLIAKQLKRHSVDEFIGQFKLKFPD